jgi:5-methyltetrahydropteroyltriglutamate--homocysteine methyltransferase
MITEQCRKLPALYTHVIGSLPRPKILQHVLNSKDQMENGRYTRLMDDMVRFAIRFQEEAGLDVVSDGEWRRIHYTDEFLKRIGGFEPVRPFEHQGETKYTLVVVDKVSPSEPVFAADAAFLRRNTDRITKFALPSPFLIATRYWHERFSGEAYPTRQHFLDELAAILAREAGELVEAGIDIVQLDDPALTYFCDHRLTSGQYIHDERLRREWEAEQEIPAAIEAMNRIVEGLHACIHLHCCHSVYKRMSDVVGDYKPLLPYLKDAAIDQVNLEFAYKGTGVIDDLKYLPDGLMVGMGVVDVRGEHVSRSEEIKKKVCAAIDLVGIERIALNPDCGFAPDAFEPPTIDEAFDKLCRLTGTARELRDEYGV